MFGAKPLGQLDWALMMEFAARFEADFDQMNADGARIPDQLSDAANELTNLACDISCNGDIPSEWKGCRNRQSIDAQKAALRLIFCAATELGLFVEQLEADLEEESV